MKVRPFQSTLNAGELSKKLRGRMNVARYTNGLELCRNALPMLPGGCTRRPGTLRVAQAAASGVKFIPFVAMVDGVLVSYLLEFTAAKIRFFSGATKQQILTGGVPVEVATPYAAADLDRLVYEVADGALYLWHADFAPRKLTTTDATTWSLTAVPFESIPFFRPEGTGAITLTPGALTGATTLTASADLFVADHVDVKFQVNGGIFKVTGFTDAQHVNAVSVKRILVTNSLTQIDEVIHFDITLASLTGPATITVDVTTTRTSASDSLLLETAQTLPADEAGLTFAGTQVADISDGKEIYYDTIEISIDNATLGGDRSFDVVVTSKIIDEFATADSTTTFTVGSVVTPNPLPAGVASTTTQNQTSPTGLEADDGWEEESWSDVRGWPAVGSFYKQRMFSAATKSQPLTVWGSMIGAIENNTAGTYDDEAFSYTIDETSAGVQFLVKSAKLQIMAADIELALSGGDAPLSPLNIQVDHITSHGCSDQLRPVKLGKDLVYASLSGLGVRVTRYSLEKDGIVAPEVGYLAEHLLADGGGVVSAAFSSEPYPVVWFITATGALLTLTIDQDQEVTAWAKQETSGMVEDVAVIPGSDKKEQVWIAVKRGSTTQIEILDDTLNTDSAVVATDTDTVAGLDHLEGFTVDILADGYVLTQMVVDGGQVVLDVAYSAIEVGLPYKTTIKDLPPFVEGGVTAKAKVQKAAVLLHETKACKVNGQPVTMKTFPDGILDAPLKSFTGWKDADVSGGWSEDGSTQQLEIVQDLPLPLTVLAIAKEVSINA